MRDLHDSIELLDLIESINTWRKTSMETKDVAFNDSGQWEVVEKTREILPNISVSVLSQTLVIESIYLSDLLAFVVTSQDSDSVSVSDLEGHEESHCLNGVISSINIVSHEKVVVIRK